MPKLERLMNLAMTGSVLMESLLIKRFLLGMAAVLVLAVIIGVIVAVLLIAGLYLAYHLLQEHGMASDIALLATGGIGMTAVFLCAVIIARRLRLLRRNLMPQHGLADRVEKIGEAFVEGLMTSSTQ